MQEDPHRDLQGSPGSGHQGALHKTLPSPVKRKRGRARKGGGRDREREDGKGGRERGGERGREREGERECVSINTLLNDLWFPYDIVECFLNTSSSILYKRSKFFKLLTLSKQLVNLQLQPMNHQA